MLRSIERALTFRPWTGCQEIPDASAVVGAAQQEVDVQRDRNDDCAGQLKHWTMPLPLPCGSRGRRGKDLLPEEDNDDNPKKDINQRDGSHRDDKTGHRRNRLPCEHDPLDDPRLPADLRHKPASLDRDQAERRGENHCAEQVRMLGEPRRSEGQNPGEKDNQDHQASARHHHLKGNMDDLNRRLKVGRKLVQAFHDGIRIVISEQAESLGDLNRAACLAPLRDPASRRS